MKFSSSFSYFCVFVKVHMYVFVSYHFATISPFNIICCDFASFQNTSISRKLFMKIPNKCFIGSEEFQRRNHYNPRTFCAILVITITKLAFDNIFTCEKSHCFRQIFPGNVFCFCIHELLNRLIFCLLSYSNLDLQYFVDFIFDMLFFS